MQEDRINGEEGDRLEVEPLLPFAADRRLAREVAELAAEHFPARWIRRSNASRPLRVTTYFPVEAVTALLGMSVVMLVWGFGLAVSIGSGVLAGVILLYLFRAKGFGSYSGWSGILALGKLEGDERDANIVHELGHRMQQAVPGLVEHEREFLARKLGRMPTKWGPVEFGTRFFWFLATLVVLLVTLNRVDLSKRRRAEKARGVYHEYVVYERPSGRSFEVFTMGLQGLRFGAKDPETMEFDPELRPYDDHRELVERVLEDLG